MFISQNAAAEEGKCGSCELKGSDGKKYRVCVAKASVGEIGHWLDTPQKALERNGMRLVLTFSFVNSIEQVPKVAGPLKLNP